MLAIPWENSWHFATPPLVFPRKKQAHKFQLMTYHYPDLGSAFDWSRRLGNLLQPIRSTTQIWVVTRHQYGISALVSLTSFRGLFSEATLASFIILSCARLYLPGKRYWGKPRSCDQHDQTKHWRRPNQPTARPWIRSGSSLSSASYRILSPTESEGQIERKKNTAS